MAGFRDVDTGYKDLVSRVFKLGKPKVTVGVFEAEGGLPHDGSHGATIVEVATWNEFGLGVPERSFIRAWFDANEERAREALRRLLVSVVAGERTKEQALETFGLWVQGQIQARIAEGISPPNAESTIAEKGSSTPLIKDGQLRSSITFKVEP